jgi:hypothetical protein
VKIADSKTWIPTSLLLSALKLTIGHGKPETGSLKKKKKAVITLPVTLNLPDCTISPIFVSDLDKKYAERAIQVLDRLTSVIYLLALEPADLRGDWTRALTLASLTILPSQSIGKSAGSKLRDGAAAAAGSGSEEGDKLPVRSRSLSLFGANKRPNPIKTDSPKSGTSPNSPISPSSPSSPSSSSSAPSLEIRQVTASPKETLSEAGEAAEKKKRRSSLIDRLRPRSDSVS